jgi:hypothetical protein
MCSLHPTNLRQDSDLTWQNATGKWALTLRLPYITTQRHLAPGLPRVGEPPTTFFLFAGRSVPACDAVFCAGTRAEGALWRNATC